MEKPSWFRPLDAAAFLIPILTGTAALIYAMVVGAEGTHVTEGLIIGWVVIAMFIGIWARVSWLRKKSLDEFTWYPTYGFMVHPGGYQLPQEGIFDGSVFKTIQVWSKYHTNAEKVVKEKVNWVWFKKGLDESPKNPAKMKVNGLTVAGTHLMQVDYDLPNDPFERTAFEHELGHVIHGHATNTWNLAEHHEFARSHGLR